MPEEPRDKHISELIPMMDAILEKNPDAELFIKWTCPQCGERAMSSDANVFHASGYLHEDCGFLYTGEYFGFMAAFTVGRGCKLRSQEKP